MARLSLLPRKSHGPPSLLSLEETQEVLPDLPKTYRIFKSILMGDLLPYFPTDTSSGPAHFVTQNNTVSPESQSFLEH